MGRSTHLRRAARGAAAATGAAIAITATGAIPAVADQEHRVSAGDTVSALAVRYHSSVSHIVRSNDLDSQARIVVGQRLSIPSASSPKATKTAAVASASATYTVAMGDTVWGLAKRHGTSVSAIVKANSLGATAMIRVGQQLSIPGAAQVTSGSAAGASTAAPSSGTHTVAAGDTVWDLAREYGTTVSAITKANGLSSTAVIGLGQKLSIPGASGASSSATTVAKVTSTSASSTLATDTNLSSFGGATTKYTVKPGDTVGAIAAKHGVSTASIVSANGLGNASLIRIGQTLTVPGGTPTGLVGDTFAGRTYSSGVVGAANQNKATLNAMSVPSRGEMRSMVVAAANRYGVSPALAQAIATQESGFNMRAVSPANAVGVMQVIPSSGEWASDLVGRDLNLLNPIDNVEAGIAILAHLTRGGRDLDIAIAGYYQGERGVAKYGMYSDTKSYVASVKSLMGQFS